MTQMVNVGWPAGSVAEGVDSRHGIAGTGFGLVRPLFEGPVDIVGDVHGEIVALHDLLGRLGYDGEGRHRQGRRLIFVGDLCDRGPDSPAVIELVQALVAAGRAQCVLGNHELNLLRGERKHGNHWFYGDDDPAHLASFGPCVMATPAQRPAFLAFFSTLALALERSDLRVVHAGWHDPSIQRCREVPGDARAAYRGFEELLSLSAEGARLRLAHDLEKALHTSLLNDTARVPPPCVDVAAYEEYYQTENPIRVLSSGLECATPAPFRAGGKWRFVERVRWWREYDAPQAVVFGHYWRWWHPSSHLRLSKGEPNLFLGEDACGWHANARGREVAFCVDYSVGARFKERMDGQVQPFHGRPAAMRWPEREVVFDHDPAAA